MSSGQRQELSLCPKPNATTCVTLTKLLYVKLIISKMGERSKCNCSKDLMN